MPRNKKKIIRTITVPQSIDFLEEIMLKLKENGYETVLITSPGKELEESTNGDYRSADGTSHFAGQRLEVALANGECVA